MGRRGPPKKPAGLKKAQGTYQKCRDAAEEASQKPASGEPPLPRGLSGAGLRRWREVVPELLRIGTLSVVDGGALEAYCRAWARWVRLERMTKSAPVGDAATESRKLHKEVIQPLELALGLHFAARARVRMPEKPKEVDPVEQDIFGEGPALKALPGGKVETA